MQWWFKCRRAHTLLPGGLSSFLVILLLLQDRTVFLPSFLSGVNSQFVFVLVSPIPVCATLLMALESRLVSAEEAAVRRIVFLDSGMVLLVSVVAAALAAALGTVLGSPGILMSGRNVIFLVGLMLCARTVIGPAAVMVPVFWIFCVALFGYGSGANPYFWTVLPQKMSNPIAAVASILALLLGLAAQLSGVRLTRNK